MSRSTSLQHVPTGGVRLLLARGSWTILTNAGTKVEALALIVGGGIAGGLSGVGTLAAVFAAGTLASSVADFGYASEVARFVAAHPSRAPAIVSLRGGLWRGAVALGLGIVLSFGLVPSAYRSEGTIAAVGVIAASLFLSTLATQVAYGWQRFRASSILTACTRAPSILLVPALAATAGIGGAVLAVVLVEIVTAAVVLTFVVRTLPAPDGEATELRPTRRHIWLGLGSIANTVINRSDTALVSSATAAGSVGVYSLASQAENAVTTIALAPATGVPTHVAIARSRNQDFRRTVNVTCLSVGLLTAVGSVLIVAASFLYPATDALGIARHDLDLLHLPLIICMAAAPLSSMAGVLLLAQIGQAHHRGIAAVWTTTAVVTIPTMWLLARAEGALGAATGAAVRDLVLCGLAAIWWATGSRSSERS